MRARTAAVASIALALVQYRLIYNILGSDYPRSIMAAFGVVHGRPHWRIYQSRILGPYLLNSLTNVMPGGASAYVLTTIALLVVGGLLACRLGNRIAGEPGAWRALFATHAAFAFLLAKPWLYIWDYYDLVIFLAFTLFVIEKRPTLWFVGLWAAGMINHEIALFIAIWLGVDGVVKRFDWVRIATSVACIIGGLVLIELLRRGLLVEEVGPKMFADAPKGVGSSFYFTLWHNVRDTWSMLTVWDYRLMVLVVPFVAGIPVVAWWVDRREPAWRSLAIVFVLLLGALVTFGLLVEARIYIPVIPLLALGAALTARPADVRAA